MKVAFIGKLQSGKTTAVKYYEKLIISRCLPVTSIKFATPLYGSHDLFNLNNEFKNRSFLQKLSDLAKECFGQDILSRVFTRNLSDLGDGGFRSFLCDDVRVSSDFNTAKSFKFYTVGIKSSDKNRKNRKPETFTGTKHKTETEIDKLIKKCDTVITNDGSLEEFEKKLLFIYKRIAY